MLLNKPKFRFHVIGLPHTATNKNQYLHCAYTQKVLNFCKMMHNNGHYVIHYGGEDSEVECDEHVTIMTTAKRNQWFKSNWGKGEFPDMQFDETKPYWMWANANAIIEISKRIEKYDFICLITSTQSAIANAFPNNISVEYGVGYEGVSLPFLCFESEAWRHHVYGLRRHKNGNWYDRVIYNYYDQIDFPLGAGDGDYYLFLGRIISRKNPHVAADICQRIGSNLVIAGQGATIVESGKICSQEVTILGKHVHYVGVVDVATRAELLGGAKALFVLTQYIAPFEGVHAEAALCGCPVITTDWGVFPETVEQGVTGYRVRTIGEAMWAAKNVDKLDRSKIREKALSKFSLEVIAPQYEEWFERLYGLKIPGKDFYDEGPGRFADD